MAFCRCHHLELSKVELFSFLIANQMQLDVYKRQIVLFRDYSANGMKRN